MELTERKLMILKAIIDEYISTGLPVGSRTLTKREEIGFSSATIRNEMADLEDMGYLYSPMLPQEGSLPIRHTDSMSTVL